MKKQELDIKNKNNCELSLNLMPSFYHKHTGMEYGEGYYFDLAVRAEIEANEKRFLYEILGKYGEGDKNPEPSTTLFIQPVDLIMITQGAEIRCPIDGTLETWGNPWSKLSIDEIIRIDPANAANHPVLDKIIKQYHEMVKIYGNRADIFGIKAGNLVIHTPYTTAHQLYGDKLFYKMLETPEEVRIIMTKIWQLYRNVFERLRNELQAPEPSILNLGDCSACMLSPDVYRDIVLPVNIDIAAGFKSVTYHSCGGSTHLLNDFTRLPGLHTIELGPGTDLTAGVKLLPGIIMAPLLDPVSMRNNTTPEIEKLVGEMICATAPAPKTIICAWSLDSETPLANLEALYTIVYQ